MTDENEQETEQAVETEAPEPQPAPVVDAGEDFEAHVWRAQS